MDAGSDHWSSRDAVTGAGTASEAGAAPSARRGLWAVAAGGLMGALAAASCCVMPLALFGLGVSGAWLGTLTALAPYQPVFVAATLGFLAAGYWLAYRRPRAACAGGSACARPPRLVRMTLWTATVLVAAAVAFPYVAPALLPA